MRVGFDNQGARVTITLEILGAAKTRVAILDDDVMGGDVTEAKAVGVTSNCTPCAAPAQSVGRVKLILTEPSVFVAEAMFDGNRAGIIVCDNV